MWIRFDHIAQGFRVIAVNVRLDFRLRNHLFLPLGEVLEELVFTQLEFEAPARPRNRLCGRIHFEVGNGDAILLSTIHASAQRLDTGNIHGVV